MKKILIVSAIVVVILAALGVTGYAYAQSATPSLPFAYGPGMMRGCDGNCGEMMGGTGGRGRGMMGQGGQGLLQPYMLNAWAEAFDMTPEALQARWDAGDTCWEIAQENDLTEEQFKDLMIEVRTAALGQAVTDGVITQAQADWMVEHMNQMGAYGDGSGSCPRGGSFGGGRGPGQRWNTQPAQPQG